jgi:hypothetical protein
MPALPVCTELLDEVGRAPTLLGITDFLEASDKSRSFWKLQTRQVNAEKQVSI